MMKVLMFGWEFPPHISGGLGTACYGLTSALIKENTEVLFVVPKLYGNEPQNGSTFINASEIETSHESATRSTVFDLSVKTINRFFNREVIHEGGITTIKIRSALSGYNLVSIDIPSYNIKHWNYEFNKSSSPETTYSNEERAVHNRQYGSKTFSFSGGYGQRLMEEVYEYALVATELARDYEYDVIHAHDWMTFPAAIAAKKVSGKPLIVHIHATEYDRAGKHGNPMVYNIEKEAMQEADRVVAVSQWTKNVLIARYHISKNKIDVVHNGIIPHANEKKEDIHPIGTEVVTFLGRITYQKGPEYFVEAAKKVNERFPEAHFIMAGAGDFLPQIITKVAQLKLSSRFHFTGFLRKREIDRILSYTRVYVMPSVSEPFGITPLEAVQAGVPVIISNQSGVGEIMKHALKVDFWDTDALSQAICSVLQYKSLSDTLKKHGAEEINLITWEKAAKKLKYIYHEIAHTTK